MHFSAQFILQPRWQKLCALFLSLYCGLLSASELPSVFFLKKKTIPLKTNHNALLNPALSQDKVLIDETFLQTKTDSLYLQAERALFRQNRAKALNLLKQALLFQKEVSYLKEKLAGIYIIEGLHSQAFFQYLSILQKEPENQNIRFQLAKLYTQRNLYREALAEYTVLQNQKPGHFEFGFEKALVFSKAKLFDKALNQIHKISAQAKRTEQIRLHLLKAHIYKLLKKPELQKKALDLAISLKPVKEMFVRNILTHYMALKDLKGARNYLLSYQERQESSLYAAKILSEICLILNDKKSLLEQLEKIKSFGALTNPEAFQLALLLTEQKQYTPARRFFIDLLQDKTFVTSAHYFLGFIAEQKKQFQTARSHYRKVKFPDPYFFNAETRRAWLLKENGEREKALKVTENLTLQFQKVPLSFLIHARLLKELNKDNQVLKTLAGARQLFPNHPDILFLQGFYLSEMERTDQAVLNMKQILKTDPNHFDALNFLAYTYAEQADPHLLNTAEKIARKALLIKPTSGYILDTLGWVLYRKGHIKQALSYLKKAFEANSQESLIAEHLGEAYHKLKKYKQSALYFKKAAELSKDNKKREVLKKRIIALAQQNP